MARDEGKMKKEPKRPGFDPEINRAKEAGKEQVKTMPRDEMDGYLGVDDLDRIRRENLKHITK